MKRLRKVRHGPHLPLQTINRSSTARGCSAIWGGKGARLLLVLSHQGGRVPCSIRCLRLRDLILYA